MNARLLVPAVVLAGFSAYTVMVMAEAGPTGFLALALREPWGMQMLLDVGMSLGCFAALAIPDARARGITVWPYLVACVFLGSPAAIAYFVHRALRTASDVRTSPAAAPQSRAA